MFYLTRSYALPVQYFAMTFFDEILPKMFLIERYEQNFPNLINKKLWFFCCRKWLLTIFPITLLLKTLESISLGFWIGTITPSTTPHKAYLGSCCVRRAEALRVIPNFEPPVFSYLEVMGGWKLLGTFFGVYWHIFY